MNCFFLQTILVVLLMATNSASRGSKKQKRRKLEICDNIKATPATNNMCDGGKYEEKMVDGVLCCKKCKPCGKDEIRLNFEEKGCNATCITCKEYKKMANKKDNYYKHSNIKCEPCTNCTDTYVKTERECTDNADTKCSEECIHPGLIYDAVEGMCINRKSSETTPVPTTSKMTVSTIWTTTTTVRFQSMKSLDQMSETNRKNGEDPLVGRYGSEILIGLTAICVVVVLVILTVGIICMWRRSTWGLYSQDITKKNRTDSISTGETGSLKNDYYDEINMEENIQADQSTAVTDMAAIRDNNDIDNTNQQKIPKFDSLLSSSLSIQMQAGQ